MASILFIKHTVSTLVESEGRGELISDSVKALK